MKQADQAVIFSGKGVGQARPKRGHFTSFSQDTMTLLSDINNTKLLYNMHFSMSNIFVTNLSINNYKMLLLMPVFAFNNFNAEDNIPPKNNNHRMLRKGYKIIAVQKKMSFIAVEKTEQKKHHPEKSRLLKAHDSSGNYDVM